MSAREGDIIGDRWELQGMVSYQGKEGCTDLRCTRVGSSYDLETGSYDPGQCAGYHCAHCHEPSSMYGHPECQT